MALVTPFGQDGSSDEVLSAAIEQLGSLTDIVNDLIKKMEEGELPAPAEAKRTVQEYRAWVLAAITERQKLESRRKDAAGIVHDYAIDFDAARTEIRGRLARLRAARDGGAVSE